MSGRSSSKLPQVAASCAATLGAVAMGMVMGWSAPVQREVTSGAAFPFSVSADQFSWVGSMVPLGAAASCLPTGALVGLLGRRSTMLLSAAPFVAGWALIAWPLNVEMLILGRFITGFCGGVFCVASPMYIAEIAETKIRGALSTCFQLAICIGLEISYISGALISVFTLTLISALVPIIFCIIFFFMPETPHYLFIKNRNDEAKKSLKWLRGSKYNSDNELEEIKQFLNESSTTNKLTFLQMFTDRIAVKGLLIMAGVMALQQLSGINAVLFYASDIFASAGSDLDPEVSTIIIGGVLLLATIPATVMVDKAGRRVLLLVSAVIMALAAVVLGFYFLYRSDLVHVGWLPLASLVTFIIAFSFGAGPVAWILAAEIFAPEIKGHACALSALFSWTLSFFVTKFYVNMVNAFETYTTFWIFGICCMLGAAHVIFFVPETKGKTTEQILKQLEGTSDDTK